MRVLGVAEVIEQLADPACLGDEVARVEAHGAQLRAGDLHGGPDALLDVVGVHQQGRSLAQGGHLGLERLALGVVQQREGVRARWPTVGTP
jgi:hypothetical protein